MVAHQLKTVFFTTAESFRPLKKAALIAANNCRSRINFFCQSRLIIIIDFFFQLQAANPLSRCLTLRRIGFAPDIRNTLELLN